jgi:hypothetical protein
MAFLWSSSMWSFATFSNRTAFPLFYTGLEWMDWNGVKLGRLVGYLCFACLLLALRASSCLLRFLLALIFDGWSCLRAIKPSGGNQNGGMCVVGWV